MEREWSLAKPGYPALFSSNCVGHAHRLTVHATDGAQVAAPEALGEQYAAGDRPGGDQRQQPAGQRCAAVQVPHILPDQDGCSAREWGKGAAG